MNTRSGITGDVVDLLRGRIGDKSPVDLLKQLGGGGGGGGADDLYFYFVSILNSIPLKHGTLKQSLHGITCAQETKWQTLLIK